MGGLPPGVIFGALLEDNGQTYNPIQQQTVPVAEGGTVVGAGRWANHRLPDGEIYGIVPGQRHAPGSPQPFISLGPA